MKKVFCIFAIAVAVLTITGCGKSEDSGKVVITLDEYNKVETGISYEELTELIGGECEKNAEQEMAGIKQTIYSCYGGKEAAALFTFRNNELTLKTQTGLK